jgi:hypothetical protein
MKRLLITYLVAIFMTWSYQSFASIKVIESARKSVVVYSGHSSIEINAYPNPFNEGVTLEIITNNSHPTTLKVFDIIGIEREKIELTQFGTQNVYHIQLKDLPAGVYFCNVYSDKKLLESKKIICLK